MTHELKCWPEPFDAVWDGKKNYEVRRSDRAFVVGDRIRLRRFNPKTGRYTGREVCATVSYMTAGGTWGLPSGLCVLGLTDATRFPITSCAASRAPRSGADAVGFINTYIFQRGDGKK